MSEFLAAIVGYLCANWDILGIKYQITKEKEKNVKIIKMIF